MVVTDHGRTQNTIGSSIPRSVKTWKPPVIGAVDGGDGGVAAGLAVDSRHGVGAGPPAFADESARDPVFPLAGNECDNSNMRTSEG
jgi:hypothetical protein